MYLWGAGRHGQLAEAGRNVMIPVAAPSFSQAQQVIIKKQSQFNDVPCTVCAVCQNLTLNLTLNVFSMPCVN